MLTFENNKITYNYSQCQQCGVCEAVFAINFGKPFIEILPNNATGTRNQSILELTGLSNRILRDFDDYSLINQMIDYNEVHYILEVEREKSVDVMKSLLA